MVGEVTEAPFRLVVGLSGSSAPQLGVSFLKALGRDTEVESHLILSAGATKTIEMELGMTREEVETLADVVYDPLDLGAAVSSGSFTVNGMVVIPCSMRTLASIATGNTDNLLARAADVTLKERRKLVLVPRETPLNLIHLENMRTVTLAGGVILPPVPAFYHKPRSIDDLLLHTCGKVLDQFGIPHQLFRRWS
jgi:polyprenyl P-hydroxybenzoate/phenylacrylic acid decarboxylase-like protein